MSNVDLTVMPGDRVGLVGQNGAGKSTLLQCIAGYRPMDEGTCVVKSGARMGELLGESKNPRCSLSSDESESAYRHS